MRAKEFDIAKFILILGVIMIHSNIYVEGGENFSPGGMFLMKLFPGAICSICVPSFFILSGFLYFNKVTQFSKSVYIHKSRRRLHTLLIPYLLWNIIGLIILLFKSEVFGFPSFGIITDHGLSVTRMLEGFWSIEDGYPFAFAFWFIRNLIIFSILSPIAFLLAKRKFIFVSFLLLISVFDISLWGFEFFLIGAFAALHFPANHLPKTKLAIVCGIIWMGLSLIKTLTDYWGEAFLIINSLAACYAILYVSDRLKAYSEKHAVNMLLKSTFCLYAFHQFYVTVIRKLYENIFGVETFVGVAAAFLSSWLTLIGLSFLLWLILEKASPRLIAILSGNRS